jgi:hypothetical protein
VDLAAAGGGAPARTPPLIEARVLTEPDPHSGTGRNDQGSRVRATRTRGTRCPGSPPSVTATAGTQPPVTSSPPRRAQLGHQQVQMPSGRSR